MSNVKPYEAAPKSLMKRTESSLPASKGVSGTRVAVSLASWALAGLGFLSSIMFAGAAVHSLTVEPWPQALTRPANYFGLVLLLAWLYLAVMTIGWVRDRKVHWSWPLLGCVTGIPSAIAFLPFFFLYASSIGLATYLVFYHLPSKRHSANNAA